MSLNRELLNRIRWTDHETLKRDRANSARKFSLFLARANLAGQQGSYNEAQNYIACAETECEFIDVCNEKIGDVV